MIGFDSILMLVLSFAGVWIFMDYKMRKMGLIGRSDKFPHHLNNIYYK